MIGEPQGAGLYPGGKASGGNEVISRRDKRYCAGVPVAGKRQRMATTARSYSLE